MFISIGALVSVLGAFLAWTLICAGVLFAAGKSNDMPRLFAAQNSNEVPTYALWLSNIVCSLFIISTYWSPFNFMLDMTSVTTLLPYLLGPHTAFCWRAAASAMRARRSGRDQIFAGIAVAYTIFMFVAAGLNLCCWCLLFAPGTILYVWARREQNARRSHPRRACDLCCCAHRAAIGITGS